MLDTYLRKAVTTVPSPMVEERRSLVSRDMIKNRLREVAQNRLK